MTPETAKQDIIDFRTLPPQIDYTEPYRIKAHRAEQFLRTLSRLIQHRIFTQIDYEVNQYYASGLADLDSKF